MSHIMDAADFDAKVINAQGQVLVDFYADWCGPCKMVAPIVEEIEKEKAGEIAVYSVNVDECPDVAGRYGIMSIPMLFAFQDGKIKDVLMGAQPKQSILAMFA